MEVRVEEPDLLLPKLRGAQDDDAFRREQRAHALAEATLLRLHQLVGPRGDGREHLHRDEAVELRRLIAGADTALQRGHADHEELVEVRAEDCEELHPLEQGHAGVLRLLEHAAVELEP